MPISLTTEGNLWLILIAVIAYFLGSVPTAYFVTRSIIGKDIRFTGSRNIGAMNAYRLIRDEKSTKLGIAGFFLALVGDGGKGILAIFAAKWLSFLGYDLLLALIIGSFFVVLGHNYSVFFKFKEGGRGLSSFGGILLALNPLLLLIWLGTILLVTFLAEYLLVAKINWGKFSRVFSVVGSQVVGRVAGIAIALLPFYFFAPELFFPILAATILMLIKHIERTRVYIKQLPSRKVGLK